MNPRFALLLVVLLVAAISDAHMPRARASSAGVEGRAQDVFGRTPQDSSPPRWPQSVKAPKQAPNVVIIMTDDVGFGASSTFGGPIPTFTFDALARSGIKYNAFHTTALCSPTRASLLTGRNHHDVAMGVVQERATGYQGYTGILPNSAATIAEILKANGFNTALFGKWHLVPYQEMGPQGPFDRWPTGKGFEHFYGFLGGETDQWEPTLWEDTHPVEPPRGDPSYILDRDLADRAIAWIHQQKALEPEKPFFIYYAPGTAHTPIHAPKEWIAKFKGAYDQGWDKLRNETFARQKKLGIIPENAELTLRPKEIPAWESLSPEQKRTYAHMMEAYAGALSHADFQIGRVIEAVRETGTLDNTIIFYIQGDNGASAEGGLGGYLNDLNWMNGIQEDASVVAKRIAEFGGPTSHPHYPAGWAWAMNTPFQWYKQIASHFGGTRNGLVVSWPAVITDVGGMRTQFHHVIDVAPTILEATGINPPKILNGAEQKPIEGTSMVYSFAHPNAASTHKVQYFEMYRNMAIYKDGWIAGTKPSYAPWEVLDRGPWKIDDQEWQLFNVADDFSQAKDLHAKFPEKLRNLQDLFWIEAARNHVLPILGAMKDVIAGARPDSNTGRSSFTYYPGMTRVPAAIAPDVRNRSFEIVADVELADASAEGVLATMGGRFGGYSFYLLHGRPVFYYNAGDLARYAVVAADQIPAGTHRISVDFTSDGGVGRGGTAALLVDGHRVVEGKIDRTLGRRFPLDGTFLVGKAAGSPVSNDYAPPFAFNGDLHTVTINLK